MLVLHWIVLVSAVASHANALIVRRHDRPDSAYVALARNYPSVGFVGRIGTVTLINTNWVITAAHVARAASSRANAHITIASKEYGIRAVHIHPEWTDLGPHDVALIELDRAVPDVTPTPLCTQRNEAGVVATFVGFGASGTGNSNTRIDDDVKRAATSKVDSVNANELFFSFDVSPAATELEGAPSRGDSGGPAMLTFGAQTCVAGISSAGYDGDSGPSSYGAIDSYTRVSTHLPWLHGVMATKGKP